MNDKPLDLITKADIEALVTDAVQESKALDFKETLPGNSDGDKKDFLADVSSFANTNGGDLYYGIKEKDGAANEAVGITNFDEDAARLQFEQRIPSGIGPRIPGFDMKVVDGFPKGPVLVMRIPKSWMGPHMVIYKGSSKFYSRHSAGKTQMDVGEIRQAFARSEELPERIRRWRKDRVLEIVNRLCPIALEQAPKLVLHLIPYDSFDNELRLSVDEMVGPARTCPPLGTSGGSHRINVDGVVTFDEPRGGHLSLHYCQLFRSGRIEAVNADVAPTRVGDCRIASVSCENDIIFSTSSYLEALRTLGIVPPIVMFLTLVHAKGAIMATDPRYQDMVRPIDRELLYIPGVLIETYGEATDRVLRPVLDAVSNACGLPRSLNYDDMGNWKPR